VLWANRVGSLLDCRAQSRDAFLIDRRKVADLLFEIGELTGGARDLDVLGTVF
jgi:hypothetical protein